MTFKLGFIFEPLQILNHSNIEYNISNHQNFKRHGYKIMCKPLDLLWKIIPLPESWCSPPPPRLLGSILNLIQPSFVFIYRLVIICVGKKSTQIIETIIYKGNHRQILSTWKNMLLDISQAWRQSPLLLRIACIQWVLWWPVIVV